MIKIHFERGVVYLSKEIPETAEKSALVLEDRSMEEIVDLLLQYQENRLDLTAYLIHPHPEELFSFTHNKIEFIRASGGVIENENGELLFIFRRSKWDLPKGKIEPGEETEAACLRELEEECGLRQLQILHLLTRTYHTYRLKNKLVLKETTWFKVKHTGQEQAVPQTEEDISEVAWFKPTELEHVYRNTFPSIQEVLNLFNN